MTPAFQVAHAAAKDIDEILEYILLNGGRQAAVRVTERLHADLRLLSGRPELGHLRHDLTRAQVRFWRVWSYMVVYRPDAEPIEIVRVLHGARDLRELLEDL